MRSALAIVFVAVPLTAIITAGAVVLVLRSTWPTVPPLPQVTPAIGTAPETTVEVPVLEGDAGEAEPLPPPSLLVASFAQSPVDGSIDATAVTEPAPAEAFEVPVQEPNGDIASSVDYAKLHRQMKEVSDRLEQFNRKLLQVIGRVPSEDPKREGRGGAGTAVALGEDAADR